MYNYYWYILSQITGKVNPCPLLQPPLYGNSYSQPVGVSKNLQLRTLNAMVSIQNRDVILIMYYVCY